MDERVQQAVEFEEIDLGQVLRVLLKWRWVWTGITAVSVLSAAILSYFVLPPVYQAEMTLMVVNAAPNDVQRRVIEDPTLEQVVNPLAFLPQMTIKTYVAQLTSPKLLIRVRDQVGLDKQLYDEQTLAGMIKAEQIRDTNLIRVRVEHSDPVLARRIAETLAAEFFATIEENITEQLERSVGLLNRQLDATRAELDAAIARWNEARSKPRSMALVQQEYETKRKLLEDVRAALVNRDVEVATLRDALAALDAELARTPETVEVRETSSTPGQGETVTTRTEPNPAYESLVQLRQQKAADLARAEAEAAALRARLETLQQEVIDLQAELVKVGAEEKALERQVQQLEQTFNLLSQKMAETKALQAGNLAETSVLPVSPPLTPTSPVRPRKLLNMAVAGMLGAMIGLFATFVLERFDNTVKTPEDVERLIGVPVLGDVPLYGRGHP